MNLTTEMIAVIITATSAYVGLIVYIWYDQKTKVSEALADKASVESMNRLAGIVNALSEDVHAVTRANHATDLVLSEIRLQVGRCVSHLESEQEWRKEVHERQSRLEIGWLKEISLLRQSLSNYGRRPADKQPDLGEGD